MPNRSIKGINTGYAPGILIVKLASKIFSIFRVRQPFSGIDHRDYIAQDFVCIKLQD